ncbi:methyltransferase family protein [Gilvimarinus sp. F26214L]|uniref:methyltransferase family protein n=1 Tax=Gilvimarinus sp. DZF01 TaxID=3461371 RepID=UPI004045669C
MTTNWLEHRIPPPLIALAVAALMWLVADITPPLREVGNLSGTLAVLFLLLGLAVCGAGVLCFRRAHTTVDPLHPDKASTLVTEGVYRLTRNPMYLGFVLFLLAWGAYLWSGWAILVSGVFILYMNRFQIGPEERALIKVFGEEYTAYRQRVGRWL